MRIKKAQHFHLKAEVTQTRFVEQAVISDLSADILSLQQIADQVSDALLVRCYGAVDSFSSLTLAAYDRTPA